MRPSAQPPRARNCVIQHERVLDGTFFPLIYLLESVCFFARARAAFGCGEPTKRFASCSPRLNNLDGPCPSPAHASLHLSRPVPAYSRGARVIDTRQLRIIVKTIHEPATSSTRRCYKVWHAGHGTTISMHDRCLKAVKINVPHVHE